MAMQRNRPGFSWQQWQKVVIIVRGGSSDVVRRTTICLARNYRRHFVLCRVCTVDLELFTACLSLR